jgi:hypothetical protein
MAHVDPRRHVLVWVTAEYIQSEGMLHILQEAGALPGSEPSWVKILEASENTGGFALGGMLVELHHGAGIWIAPLANPGLEILIPWQFVRSVVTAQEPIFGKTFGLPSDGRKPVPGGSLP